MRFTGTGDLQDGTEVARIFAPIPPDQEVEFELTFDI
jgi:hypothetical protein